VRFGAEEQAEAPRVMQATINADTANLFTG
jgi:hypothetical protein